MTEDRYSCQETIPVDKEKSLPVNMSTLDALISHPSCFFTVKTYARFGLIKSAVGVCVFVFCQDRLDML